MNSTPYVNISVTLFDLNKIYAQRFLPSIITTIIFMIPGIIGNGLVLAIYSTKFKPSNHRTFILVLAVFDFLSCFVGMPGFIAETCFSYTFTLIWLCKALRFVFYFTPSASAITLLLIAYERFRKIYYPLQSRIELSIGLPLFFCGFVAPCVISIAGAVLNGYSTKETGIKNITGVQCNIADEYKNTVFPTVYNGVQILIIIVDALILTLFYGCIWKKISERSNFYIETKTNDKSKNTQKDAFATTSKGNNSMSDTETGDTVSAISHTITDPMNKATKASLNFTHSETQRHGTKDIGTRKITKIMTAVTGVFLASFLPHLVLILISVVIPNVYDNLTGVESVLVQIALRSLFIQCVLNPFIYAYMDDKFREACRSCMIRREI